MKFRLWSAVSFLALLLLLLLRPTLTSVLLFSSSIANAEGGNNKTIAFNSLLNKFVGFVYTGTDNNQLYSTNLAGGAVTLCLPTNSWCL